MSRKRFPDFLILDESDANKTYICSFTGESKRTRGTILKGIVKQLEIHIPIT